MSDVASMFLKLTGEKPDTFIGESESDGHEGQIEIDDWNWSLTRPSAARTSASASGDRRADNASEPSVLNFGKLMCKASAAMLQAMVDGERLTAVISLEEDSDIDFELVVTLEDVRIIEFSVSATSTEKSGKIDENWTLDYKSVFFEYVSAGSGGTVSMDPLTRRAGASKDKAQTSTESAMKEMAKKLVEEAGGKVRVGDLVVRWQQIVEEAERDYKPGRVKAQVTDTKD